MSGSAAGARQKRPRMIPASRPVGKRLSPGAAGGRGLDRLLGDYATGASPGQQKALKRLRLEVRDPDIQADFGIRVEGAREP